MTSHSDGAATDNDGAAVGGTVGTVGGGVGDGAADGTVTGAADTIIDGAVADTGSVKKRNFHTGLDPVSRTNNSAKPTKFNGGITDTVTTVSDETIVTNGKKVSSSFPQEAGIQWQGRKQS